MSFGQSSTSSTPYTYVDTIQPCTYIQYNTFRHSTQEEYHSEHSSSHFTSNFHSFAAIKDQINLWLAYCIGFWWSICGYIILKGNQCSGTFLWILKWNVSEIRGGECLCIPVWMSWCSRYTYIQVRRCLNSSMKIRQMKCARTSTSIFQKLYPSGFTWNRRICYRIGIDSLPESRCLAAQCSNDEALERLGFIPPVTEYWHARLTPVRVLYITQVNLRPIW